MKSTTKTITITTLELDQDEAAWLKSIMQNPLFAELPEDEDPRHQKMREKMWNAMNNVRG